MKLFFRKKLTKEEMKSFLEEMQEMYEEIHNANIKILSNSFENKELKNLFKEIKRFERRQDRILSGLWKMERNMILDSWKLWGDLERKKLQKKSLEKYFEVCKVLLKKYQLEDYQPYDELKKKLKHLNNQRYTYLDGAKPAKAWKFHCHHVDEIYFGKLELQISMNKYKKGKALIVSFEEHLLLHFLIFCFDLNRKSILFFERFYHWDKIISIIKEQCKKFKIQDDLILEYVKNLEAAISSSLKTEQLITPWHWRSWISQNNELLWDKKLKKAHENHSLGIKI
ncbi:hypothetical protein NPA08_01110 [Mycoplasmopsis citelli]|uniref:hypothetical protein n=1 Tax=Mycoplasmopsis citelli TaxID=171281 RepID=UPI0021151135|nr:hypothetical protein [Mycoplasmopsis citelli]UUD36421.1 hypothetical protein NPA08_01110 [Mycoplasmopsis citelli]